jgi:tRNA(fMet)-specific endonuclease VapC
MVFLADSDVIIWLLRSHAPTVRLFTEQIKETIICSVASVYEVWTGVFPREKEMTRRLLERMFPIPITAEIAYVAADYRSSFRRQGVTLGHMDTIIAATAKVEGLVLLTYNRPHFPMDDIVIYDDMPTF